MAFEAFLQRDDARPRRRRRLTFTVSVIVHAALLAGGVAYSFWRVEEISPPTVRVTFLSSAPPPPAPPPPPPAGGGDAAPRKKNPTTPRTTLTTLVQPKIVPPKKEEPRDQPPDDDDPDQAIAGGTKGGTKGGVIGGELGGVIGGTVGGTVGGVVGGQAGPKAAAPKMLAPQMGALQKQSGDDPDFPAVLRRSGMVYVVLTKICVSRLGTVDSVSILKGTDPTLDNNVVSAVRGWRYRPLLADSNAVPFCYFGRFEFKAN
ncbi:MAG TPA: energy transducer TonB [Polyangia bacterium]|jgi:protein TonB|nr:energy transducer TonB [Polyangia bacterium]